MKCENCPANQNIHGNYEIPVYGCVIDDDGILEFKSGEEGCYRKSKTIDKILEDFKKEEIHF
jgi:hypothetical protein